MTKWECGIQILCMLKQTLKSFKFSLLFRYFDYFTFNDCSVSEEFFEPIKSLFFITPVINVITGYIT